MPEKYPVVLSLSNTSYTCGKYISHPAPTTFFFLPGQISSYLYFAQLYIYNNYKMTHLKGIDDGYINISSDKG